MAHPEIPHTRIQARYRGALVFLTSAGLLLLLGRLGAEPHLPFSDPAHTPPPPAHAIGFPSRAPDLDVLPGFRQPPPGYGEVAFYWWLGDPLTKDRLAWQLEQLAAAKGVMGLQINYAHADRGGKSWGLTYPSEPALFSNPWWDLAGWFLQEAKRHGMAISLSDYTLGIGQGWSLDEVLREHPELAGMVLRMHADGRVVPETVPLSLNPMHPLSGILYSAKFFGQFEQHFPGEGGKGLNFFFSDELDFGVSGNLWSAGFAEEFQKRKGYDLTPELPALFRDTGSRTPKVRLDYRDVMVALTEQGFFKPVFDWHQQRGILYGCDHGGRGRNVVEFGDYFRTQRWNQGPGCDQPGLSCDLIKNKVASSIAHLYQRPRVWLEGFYGSGWGTSTERLTGATFANFAQGQNLLTLHGLYYSTHGGYWEWAPPCNHFRMPYWAHMDRYLAMVQRLSYLLSQGHHRCDVAVMYPVAPMEAGLGGKESVDAAFETGRQLYARGIDFDFLDFESLARATVEQQELRVSGERYRVLVLPAMRAVRWSTIRKAAEFQQAGGLVVLLGALPEASDRIGRDDPELDALVAQLPTRTEKPAGVAALVAKAMPPDFAVLAPEQVAPNFLHRRIGPREVFMVHNAPRQTECWFRATGRTELWDPWTGETRPLPVLTQTAEGTRLRLPLAEQEAQIIVFSPGQPALVPPAAQGPNSEIPLGGEWEFELQPTLDNRFGDYHWPPTPTRLGAEVRQFRYAGEIAPNPGWEAAAFNDSSWRRVTTSFGPMFWKLGPLPPNADLDAKLAALESVDPAAPIEFGGKTYLWQAYEFSWRWGIEGNPGHQGYHGLKENLTDHFIGLGGPAHAKNETAFGPEPGGSRYYLWSSVPSTGEGPAQAHAGTLKPAAAWLNHAPLAKNGQAMLRAGSNPLLLRYDRPGRTYFVFSTAKAPDPAGDVIDATPTAPAPAVDAPFSAAADWIWLDSANGERRFQKTFALDQAPAQARLRVTGDDGYRAWVNGEEVGSGQHWQHVQEFDVTSRLRAGANVMAISAHNRGGPAGMIAELLLTDAKGGTRRLATDATWLASVGSAMPPDSASWKPAQTISAYAGSLWATHPSGAPRLDLKSRPAPPTSSAAGDENYGKLAMRWFNQPDRLPFDPRPEIAQPAGWYRFRAAPGLRALTVPAAGTVQAWINGTPVSGQRSGTGWRFELAQPAVTAPAVALRIEQARGGYGGAAIPEPIIQDCAAGAMEPGDWSTVDGLACYSGGAWYRKRVRLTTDQLHGTVTLDLGKVVSSAEVRVNGQLAGIRLAPPWRVDISKHVTAGENRIEVLVYNTLANHYLTIPTRYRGELTSGLLGPVRLELGNAP